MSMKKTENSIGKWVKDKDKNRQVTEREKERGREFPLRLSSNKPSMYP